MWCDITGLLSLTIFCSAYTILGSLRTIESLLTVEFQYVDDLLMREYETAIIS